MTDKARELLERAYQYIPMSSVTSQEIRAFLCTPELEQNEEPVAWMNGMRNLLSWDKFYEDMTPLYLHPAPRPEFVRLSEEEVNNLLDWCGVGRDWNYQLICAVENRLVEKNTRNKSDPDSVDLQSRCRGDKL